MSRSIPVVSPFRAAVVAAVGGHHLHLTGPAEVAGRAAAYLADISPPLLGPSPGDTASVWRQFCTTRLPLVRIHGPEDLVIGDQRVTEPWTVGLTFTAGGVLHLPRAEALARTDLDYLAEIVASRRRRLPTVDGRSVWRAGPQHLIIGSPEHCEDQPTGHDAPDGGDDRLAKLTAYVAINVHLSDTPPQEEPDAGTAAAMVARARRAAADRWSTMPGEATVNNFASPGALRGRPWRLSPSLTAPVSRTVASIRCRDHVLRVAWSIADLAGATSPTAVHIDEALTMHGVRS